MCLFFPESGIRRSNIFHSSLSLISEKELTEQVLLVERGTKSLRHLRDCIDEALRKDHREEMDAKAFH